MGEYRVFWGFIGLLLAGLILFTFRYGDDVRPYLRSEAAFDRGVEVLRSAYPKDVKARIAQQLFAQSLENSVPPQRLDLRIARVYDDAGLPELAVPRWHAAVAQDPDLPVLLEAGAAAYSADDAKAVEFFFSEAIRRFPNDPEAYNSLGYFWADHSVRLDEAEKLILRALDLLPQRRFLGSPAAEAAYLDSLGWVHYRQGRLKEALDELGRAYRMLPGDPEVASHYRQVRKETSNQRERGSG